MITSGATRSPPNASRKRPTVRPPQYEATKTLASTSSVPRLAEQGEAPLAGGDLHADIEEEPAEHECEQVWRRLHCSSFAGCLDVGCVGRVVETFTGQR